MQRKVNQITYYVCTFMNNLHLLRLVTVMCINWSRARQSLQVCFKEISDLCLKFINPYGSFTCFTLLLAKENTVRSQRRAIAGGHKQKSVLKPGSPLVCKLAVSNEFWEPALLQGCSLAAGPSHAPLSTLPSEICPDVPSLSVAAPGGSVIGRLACPPYFTGSKPAEPCKSLPSQT